MKRKNPKQSSNVPETSKPEADNSQAQAPIKSGLRENIEAIMVAIILALFIRTFIVQAFKIPSGSMKETLQIGDHILVSKFIYGIKIPFLNKTLIPLKTPKREDIVVFKYPEDPSKDYIKRVVGIAGDWIEIKNKQLYVNHQAVESPYAVFSDHHIRHIGFDRRDNHPPFQVPPDSLFVMGDNRDNSHDSRYWGYVNLEELRGKAFMIYWSWDSEHFPGGMNWFQLWKWIRWGRIGSFLK